MCPLLPAHQPVNVTYVCQIPHHSRWMLRGVPTSPFLPAAHLCRPFLVPLVPSFLLGAKPVALSYHLQGVSKHSSLGVHLLPVSICFPVPYSSSTASPLFAPLKGSQHPSEVRRCSLWTSLLLARHLKKSALLSPPLCWGKPKLPPVLCPCPPIPPFFFLFLPPWPLPGPTFPCGRL